MDNHGDSPNAEGLHKPAPDPVRSSPPTKTHQPPKRFWLTLPLLILVIAAARWFIPPQIPPQIITMPNGVQFQLVGVTYGTNHIMGSTAARLLYRFPGPVTNLVQKYFGKWIGPISVRKSETPALCAWLLPLTTNWAALNRTPATYCKLADEHDIEGGLQILTGGGGSQIAAMFSIVPRRSRELQLGFYQDEYKNGNYVEFGRVRFPNPVYGRFPKWQPEPLPAVKRAGDLEVRLDNIMTGVRTNTTPIDLLGRHNAKEYRPSQRGERTETVFDAYIRFPSGTNGDWLMQNANLSDPGGNLLRACLKKHETGSALMQDGAVECES
jgi:hypothetical protein